MKCLSQYQPQNRKLQNVSTSPKLEILKGYKSCMCSSLPKIFFDFKWQSLYFFLDFVKTFLESFFQNDNYF